MHQQNKNNQKTQMGRKTMYGYFKRQTSGILRKKKNNKKKS